MSDSGSGSVGQITENIGEAIAKPLMNTVGDIAEEVITSVLPGTVVSPVQQQQLNTDPSKMTEEEQQKIAEARWRIEQLKKIDEQQKQVSQQNQQKETERVQVQEQEAQQEEQADMQQKQVQSQAIADAQRSTESRKGVGG